MVAFTRSANDWMTTRSIDDRDLEWKIESIESEDVKIYSTSKCVVNDRTATVLTNWAVTNKRSKTVIIRDEQECARRVQFIPKTKLNYSRLQYKRIKELYVLLLLLYYLYIIWLRLVFKYWFLFLSSLLLFVKKVALTSKILRRIVD